MCSPPHQNSLETVYQRSLLDPFKLLRQSWTVAFRNEVWDEFLAGGAKRMDGPPGLGAGRYAGKQSPKNLIAWKLADGVAKSDFRHWVEAVELNLGTTPNH